jgi:hypothetical protein
MSALLNWKTSGNNGHHAEAHTLVSEYQLVEKRDGIDLLIGAKFTATSGFQPVIREKFKSRKEAEEFAHDFELAMLRQVAKIGIAASYKGDRRSCVIVSKVEQGEMQLLYTDKDHAGKPMKLKTEVYQTEYPGTNGKVNGMRILLNDGTELFKMTMGTDSEYAALAQNALRATQDAILVKTGTLTRKEAYNLLKRAAARDNQVVYGDQEKNSEIYCRVSRGQGAIRFKDATEEFSNRNIGLTDGPNGKVHVAVFSERRRSQGDPVREVVFEQDMDVMQFLTFTGQVTEAQNTGPHASTHKQHMDMVTHVVDGNVDKALNAASNLPAPELKARILPANSGSLAAGI